MSQLKLARKTWNRSIRKGRFCEASQKYTFLVITKSSIQTVIKIDNGFELSLDGLMK